MKKTYDDEWVVNRRDLLGTCIGLLIGIPMLGIIAYGTDKLSLVKASYNITLGGLGFSLMLGMMFVSAIVARVKRQ